VARHRLGVVLLVPPPLAVEIDGLRRGLGDGALGRIPAHLTLVPPVNVTAADLPDALGRLRSAAAEGAPVRLVLGPAVTFHPVTPVVYLDVGGDVAALAALRERVFRPPLSRPLSFPFVPHVTLADDIAERRIPAAVAALADFRAEVTVDRVTLLEEHAGRHWLPVADAAFGPPAVVGRGGVELEIAVSQLADPVARRLLGDEGPAVEPEPGAWAVTARRGGEPVGVARGGTVGDRLVVTAVVVAPDHRRQGIGRHLLAAVEATARSRSLPTIALTPPPDATLGAAATALLAGAGWAPGAGGSWVR
jgi:2'-5' RNA ligase